MTPEEYRKAQTSLSDRAESVALAVAASSPLAGITLATQLGTFLATVNASARMLADAYVASFLRLPPLGLSVPNNEVDRLTAAFAGVLEDSRAVPLPRISRIARSEPTNSGREATAKALTTHKAPTVRLRWVLDPEPCDFCFSLAQKTYLPDELPQSHPNCECTVVPTVDSTVNKESRT